MTNFLNLYKPQINHIWFFSSSPASAVFFPDSPADSAVFFPDSPDMIPPLKSFNLSEYFFHFSYRRAFGLYMRAISGLLEKF